MSVFVFLSTGPPDPDMRVIAPALIVTLLLVLTAPVFAEPSVAVIGIGEDVFKTGRLQQFLTQAAARVKTIKTLPPTSIAARLDVREARPEPPWTARASAEVARLLEASRAAYYRAQMDKAATLLGQATDLHTRYGPPPVHERVTLSLHYAAVAQARGDTGVSEQHARDALILAPARSVGDDMFGGAFSQFLDDVRQDLPRVTIEIEGLPPTATVQLDGRSEGASINLPAGQHELIIRAPGFRSGRVTIDARRDRKLRASLPLALPEKYYETLRTIFLKDRLTGTQAQALLELANLMQVDGIVLGNYSAAKQQAVIVWWRTAPRKGMRNINQGSAKAARDLGAWAAEILEPGPTKGLGAAALGWRVRASGAAVMAIRSLVTEHLDLQLAGAGAQVAVEAGWQSWVAEAEAAFLTFRLSTIELPSASKNFVVNGGDTFDIRIRAGYQLVGARWRARATAGYALQVLNAQDVADRFGPLNLIPSYRISGLELATRGQFSLRKLTTTVDLFVLPSRYQDEAETLGESQKTFAWGGSAQLTLATSEWLEVGATYSIQIRSSDFSGPIATSTQNVENVDSAETWQRGGIFARTRF